MKLRTTTVFVLALAGLLATPLRADLDCAALANSPLAEPEGYAQQCLGGESAPGNFFGIESPASTGYKYDMRNNPGLYSYVVGSFPTQAFVGPGTPTAGFGWDFDRTGTTLWAHEFSTNAFGTVNTATGVFTPTTSVVLPGGQTFTGLTIDPRTDTFYVSGTDGATSTLYTLNPTTGVPTPVGNMTGLALVIDIAMNCDGEMYAHDIGADSLYQIDPATAAPTLVGAHGLAANFAQGMDFDNEDGTLYGCIYTGGGTNTYASWDTTTGAITPISTNNPLGEWECAIPTACPYVYPATQAIPALGTWGLALLALALAGFAAFALRRRSA